MKNKIYLLISVVTLLSLFTAYTYIISSSDGKPQVLPDASVPNTLIDNVSEAPASVISAPDISSPTPTATANDELSFIMPVSGQIGLNFSPGNLIYSKTLKEWVTHSGIDILSSAGTPVVASESGTIKEINNNKETGIEIVIEHDDGYKTVYSNLSTEKMVKVGQKVKKAQTISGIGRTSTFEYHEPDHLHFEIYKDGIAINPISVIN